MLRETDKPALRLRNVSANDDEGLKAVSAMHMELLGFGPMAGLGRTFVQEVCYRNHMRSDLLWVTLAEVNGEVAGLVATTPYSSTFHRKGLKLHLASTVWHTSLAILKSPVRLIRIFRSLKVLGSRREEIQRIASSVGEVVCVAVRPEFLTPAVTREIGGRLSQLLIQHAADSLNRFGVQSMRMLVDADNRPALMLYHLMGASFEACTVGGEPMTQVSFALDNDERDGLPAIWRKRAAPGADASWQDYWNTVSSKPRVFAVEAVDYADRLRRSVVLDATTRMLDFGCGFGYVAEQLVNDVRSIEIWDAAENVRGQALVRTAGIHNIVYADLSGSADPRSVFDLITIHSVIQYMSPEELQDWMRRWHTMLQPGGKLVISDILEKQGDSNVEIVRLMRFAAANGFFFDALINGVKEFSRYSRTRGKRDLDHTPPEQLEKLAETAGFEMQVLDENLSYRADRYTAVLTATAG
ncbi:MAG: class I SAM-dependent methyltransferase [Pseudomonadota bacterium]